MPEPTILDTKREPVISTDLADALADLLSEYDVASPFSVDLSLPKGPDGKDMKATARIPYDFESLPEFWDLDVSLVISKRMVAGFKKRYHAAVDALEGPYVTETTRAYLHEQHGTDGWAQPEACSLARLREKFRIMLGGEWASKHSDKMPVLHLDHAIFFNRRPDAWADYAGYIVPIDLAPVKNVLLNDVLQALHKFVDACRTSNGMSGVGSSWTVHIHPSAEFVILTSRSSIPE